MQYQKERLEYPKLYRFFEMITGILVWITIILAIFLSIFFPKELLIFAIFYTFYFLYKSVLITSGMLIEFIRMRQVENTDWKKKSKNQKSDQKFDDIFHVVLLANYIEPPEVVIPAIESIFQSNFNNKKIIVVLANEKRNQEKTKKNRELFLKKYKNKFFGTITTLHPDKEFEVRAKGANLKHAIKDAISFLDSKKIDHKNVIVSAFDCDTQVHSEYFNRLNYSFLKSGNPDRYFKSFQPIPTYLNNVWESPWFSRVVAFGTSFYFMNECTIHKEYLFTYSGHATSLIALKRTGFWSVDCINEDSKQFWRMFIEDDGNHEVIPLHLPIYMDAVQAESLIQTYKNQYKQLQRWAYGGEHIPYIFINFIKNKKLRTFSNFKKALTYFHNSYMWGSSAITMSIITVLPFVLHPELRQDLFGYNFLFFMTIFWIVGYANIFLYFLMTLVFTKISKNNDFRARDIFIMAFLQWLFYPITMIYMHGIAGFDAMNKLLFKKYLTYWTTKKIR